MTAAGRVGQRALYVAAVVASAVWLGAFIVSIGGPGDEAPGLRGHALAVAIIATPWVFAVRLLWRAWWARHGAATEALDTPGRLLAAAVATLPDDRRDWGAAMAAELAQVRDPAARWRFAAGCTRVALVPARADHAPVLAVAAWAAAVVVLVAPAVGDTLPALQFFAVTFAVLVGILAVGTAARAPRPRVPAAGPAVAVAGLAGVGAVVATTAWFLVEFPIAARHLPPRTAALLALLLTLALWVTLVPPRVLVAGGRLPRAVAVCLTVVLAGGLLLWSRLALRGVGNLDDGVFAYLYLLVPVAVLGGAAVAAVAGRSFRAGVQAAAWTAVLAAPAMFAVAVPESAVWYHHDTSLILAGDAVPLHAVGENLRNFVWALALMPFWWLPFGVVGAAGGRYVARLSRWEPTAGAGSTRVYSR